MAPWKIVLKADYVLVDFDDDIAISPELVIRIIKEIRVLDPERTRPDLWDFSGCRISPNLNYETISNMVQTLKTNFKMERPFHKTALVVNSAAGFGMARIYQSLSSELNREVMVFNDVEQARTWITQKICLA